MFTEVNFIHLSANVKMEVDMNVYDQAHKLAQAIKESEEYKQYALNKENMEKNPEVLAMINDFQKKQFELQAKKMMGEEMSEDFMYQVQELYGIMMKDPMAAQYLQNEMRFSLMINDVYKILGEAMGLSQMPGMQG